MNININLNINYLGLKQRLAIFNIGRDFVEFGTKIEENSAIKKGIRCRVFRFRIADCGLWIEKDEKWTVWGV